MSRQEAPPLLSTVAVVDAAVDVVAEDGVHDTPITLGDGVSYTGEVRDHRLCGSGTLVCSIGTYTGHFASNALHGSGTFAAAADDAAATPIVSYEGAWADGVPQGYGKMRWQNGDLYDGCFDGGQPHGTGSSGSGSGSAATAATNTFTYADGRVYVGEFDHGLRSGSGRLTQPNGDVYDGQFVRNTITGFGTATYAGGSRVFRGLFERGRKVKGSLEFPNTQRGYDGEWQDEVPHGAGRMTFANGDFYVGEFAVGQLQGLGCLYYATPVGRLYLGQFMHGTPYGKGFLYDPTESSSSGGGGGTPEATVTAGYFLDGRALAADDAPNMEEVLAATRGMREPSAVAPPYASLLQGRPSTVAKSEEEATEPFPTDAALVAMKFSFQGPRSAAAMAAAAAVSGLDGRRRPPLCTTPSDGPLGPSMSGTDASRHLPLQTPTTTGGESGLITEDTLDADVESSETACDGDGGDETEEADDVEASTELPASAMPQLPTSAADDDGCRGWLQKCSIGRRKVGFISNWRKRYFILARCNDTTCLGYYEDELCQKPIGFLRLDPADTRIVTCPTTKTHRKAKRPGRDMCVIYHERRKEYTLLLRAHNAEEHDRWAASLRSCFQIVDRPSDYPAGPALLEPETRT
ncbi:MORN repeat/PH domain containing protein [Novymonas esmeraldas]|uniref:MORN repeat/PH domain containing protein n=1 Tax=Novymonas esmeraldas TaxID=1808958 RepID=A0AAW0EVA0_9TRYP